MHRPKQFALLLLALIAGSTPLAGDETTSETSEDDVKFVREKVLPLLEARCFQCHKDAKEPKGGLLLSSRKAMLIGGDSGAAIVPGKPDESLLMEAVRYESFEMPPRSRMPEAEVLILQKWISNGAPWPKELDSAPVPLAGEFPLEARRKVHWAWQPVQNPPIPVVKDKSWTRQSLDNFILEQLESRQLEPAADADRYTIIRRLHFDILGLPPSTEQIHAFVNDPRNDDDAIAAVVDELLLSPHYGEKWARHWLDLVRYAETLGHEFDYPLHHAWRYRNYVIRAFNQDVPYDQFVTEHIAGDLLQHPRRHPADGFNESIIGTGFWFLCEDKHAPVDVKGEEASKVDNQIDVFSKSFLGMTVACARCHDHKFDAISTADYYALAGFLQSSRRQTTWLDNNSGIASRISQLKKSRERTFDAIRPYLIGEPESDGLRHCILAAISTTAPSDGSDHAKADNPSDTRDSELVENWKQALASDESKSISSHLSFLAELSTIDKNSRVSDVIRKWQARIPETRGKDSDSTPFADFTHGLPDGWFVNGPAFEGLSNRTLEMRDGTPVLNGGVGVSSAGLSGELRGTLSSPTFELTHPEILLRVRGEGSKVRIVIDGYIMYEHNALLFNGCRAAIDTKGSKKWIRLAGDIHRYQGHRAYIEFLDEGNGWFSVDEVRFANRRGANPPKTNIADINRQLADADQSTTDSLEAAVDLWLKSAARSPAASAELQQRQLLMSPSQAEAWNTTGVEWKTQASGLPAPTPVISLTDGTPEDEFIFIRGNHLNPGEVAPRNILTALRTETESSFAGSGRLRLAEQLFREDNPLTSRVAVNRIWHHLFGRGIVESTDNFGVLGKTPTHPKLLDHLAVRFRREDWSIKKLIRTLTTSRTYRMSVQHSPSADTKDPTNQFFHRSNVRRLTGEAVRDAILSVSGRLNRKMLGPPIPVKLTPFMQGRGRPRKDGPLDGDGRRSIYVAVNRNFLSPFMLAFDVPAPVSTTGRRTVSNVPAQALIMLNNEFVNQQAELWATQLLKGETGSASDILADAWFQLLGRPIERDESQALLDFLDDGGKVEQRLNVESLTEVCHVLLNSKEFLFLR